MTTQDLPRLALRGPVVQPGDGEYEQARAVWNGSIDRHPRVVARCADAADVAASLAFAQAHDLPVAVRGGGHSFPGHSVCDDGLVVDLSAMKDIALDPDRRTARVQAGVLLGELDRATQEHGLAVPAGIVTHTGIAGLTLGGGLGWLTRTYGLTVDNLLAATVVTAGGEVVRAAEDENPELLWGLRGGGGNFGVVTEFEFRLQPVGPLVLGGPVFWSIEDAPAVLRFYRDWIADAPDELMTICSLRKAPPTALVPAALHGQLVVGVVCFWAGAVDDGERVVAPLRSFGSPVVDALVPRPFVEHQALFDPSFPHGWWYYVRACDVPELDDDVIAATLEQVRALRSPLSAITLWGLGGAMARVHPDATAFSQRSAGHTYNIGGVTSGRDGFEEEKQWVRSTWEALAPYHRDSVYVNFLMDEGEERLRQAYGGAKLDRLRALKKAVDPTNVFRLNQNISP